MTEELKETKEVKTWGLKLEDARKITEDELRLAWSNLHHYLKEFAAPPKELEVAERILRRYVHYILEVLNRQTMLSDLDYAKYINFMHSSIEEKRKFINAYLRVCDPEANCQELYDKISEAQKKALVGGEQPIDDYIPFLAAQTRVNTYQEILDLIEKMPEYRKLYNEPVEPPTS